VRIRTGTFTFDTILFSVRHKSLRYTRIGILYRYIYILYTFPFTRTHAHNCSAADGKFASPFFFFYKQMYRCGDRFRFSLIFYELIFSSPRSVSSARPLRHLQPPQRRKTVNTELRYI